VNRLRVFLLSSAAVAGLSCGEHNDYALTEDDKRVVRAYASLALLHDAFPSTGYQDSVTIYHRKADSILAHYGLTRDEFRREFENLINTPERLQPLFEELSAEIRKEMQKR
jgi:hypothetical protein